MRAAVFSALDAEIRVLVEAANELSSADIAEWPVWTGMVHRHDVILAKPGLGKVNTAALAGAIWERHRPDLLG